MISILKNILHTGNVTERLSGPENIFTGDQSPLVSMDQEKCGKCGQHECVKSCPAGAIELNKAGVSVLSKKCIECRVCEDICPAGAVEFLKYGAGAAIIKMEAEKLENEVRKNFGGSFHVRQLDLGSCNGCEHEMVSAGNPFFDLSRFGIDFVASPRHADCLLITGPVTWNLREALLRTLEATPKPRVVAAMGVCAISGAPFDRNYANYGGAEKLVPVDVYIPGCPPHPYALIQGMLSVMRELRKKK